MPTRSEAAPSHASHDFDEAFIGGGGVGGDGELGGRRDQRREGADPWRGLVFASGTGAPPAITAPHRLASQKSAFLH